VLGLGGLLFSLSLRRMEPVPNVTIYGGNTTLERTRTLAAMIRSSEDAKAHVALNYVEVSPGIVFESDQLTVSAFPTNHRERPCFGYVFQSKGENGIKVVFTGDTGYMDSLVEVARGADCLVSEANFASDKEVLASRVGHLTAAQAARIAADAGVKGLMLNHISKEYVDNLELFLQEAKSIFANTIIPRDLDVFTVGAREIHLMRNLASEAIGQAERIRELETRLKRVEPLAALGTAMAALSHRMNNTLTLIAPSMLRLRKRIDPGDREAAEVLDLVDRNVRYVTDLVARINEPLREPESVTSDINTILYEAWDSTRENKMEFFKDVQTKFQLSDQVPLRRVVLGQLMEVFRNLIANAVQAMQPFGGLLTISSSYREQERMIEIEIADTGSGISPGILDRLFTEPIPSRDYGGGSGLGLWLSKLMLQRYGGDIMVKETAPNRGTTMLISLPAVRSHTESERETS